MIRGLLLLVGLLVIFGTVVAQKDIGEPCERTLRDECKAGLCCVHHRDHQYICAQLPTTGPCIKCCGGTTGHGGSHCHGTCLNSRCIHNQCQGPPPPP